MPNSREENKSMHLFESAADQAKRKGYEEFDYVVDSSDSKSVADGSNL